MAKTKDLKRRLKAADRRRRGRSNASSVQPQVATAAVAKFDVVDAITNAILKHATRSKAPVHDAAVVAALRGCMTHKCPSGNDSKELWQDISAISEHPDVSVSAFRKGVADLLQLQKTHQQLDDPGSFLGYLQFMTN
jgi:uncharacterized ParB-like nuclease family protein